MRCQRNNGTRSTSQQKKKGESRNEADGNTLTDYNWVWLSKQEERNEHPTAENASEEQLSIGMKLLETDFCLSYFPCFPCTAPQFLKLTVEYNSHIAGPPGSVFAESVTPYLVCLEGK